MTAVDPEPTARKFNTRLGITLFIIYTAFYAGFVLINAFAADWMETIVFAGLNVAIVYGFALIVVAFVMSVIYGTLCRREPESTTGSDVEGAQR